MKPIGIVGVDPGPEETYLVGYYPEGDNAVPGRIYIEPSGGINCGIYFPLRDVPHVIEMIGHYGTGMPAGKEVFDTCVWIGRYIEMLKQNCLPVYLISRPKIKAHLCGSAKAKDGNVRQALIDRLGPQGTKKNPGPTYGMKSHLWSALAVAVTAYDLWDELEEVV